MSRSKNTIKSQEGALERIGRQLGKLTPQQIKIADFVLQHPEETAFLSINKLAEKAGVSQATVVRFCRSLGYSGFIHLSNEIQQSVQARMTTSSRFKLARKYLPESDGSDASPALEHVVREELDNIADLVKNIDRSAFQECLEAMAAADRIVVIGCLSSEVLCLFLANTLSKILPNVTAITHHAIETQGILKRLTPQSLVFSIAFPRYPTATVDLTRGAKNSGARVVALSNSHISPITPMADIRFVVPVRIHSFVDSYAGPITFLTSLAVGLANMNVAKAKAGLSEFDRYAAKAGLFL